MNQEKIGKFIAEQRKKQNLTQEQLAEKLNITYKAVSKWETGKGLPDPSLMMNLCNILEISVNDLLSGEIISKDKYIDKADENLIKMFKGKIAMYNASRYGYGAVIIMLLIWNLINIFTMKDISKIIETPEFIIMDTISFLWTIVYAHFINKNK